MTATANIPTSYFDKSRNVTFEVQILTVQPNWACSVFATHRCMIGNWNFNCTHFVATGQGNGNSPAEAFKSAMLDLLSPEVMNEDSQMLGA